MREESRKEILTRGCVKTDIKNSCVNDIKIVSIRFLPFFMFAFFGLIILLMVKAEVMAILSMCAFMLIAIVTWLVFTRKSLKLIQKANKNHFEIATDDLCGCEEKHGIEKLFAYEYHIRLALNRPYRLFFMNYGEYRIPKKENYRWSDIHHMYDKDVFNYAVTHDKYYLAVIDNKEIVMVYNTKLFELQE